MTEQLIYSRQSNTYSRLILWMLVYECICCFLQKNFDAPKNIMFGIDVFWLVFLVNVIKGKRKIGLTIQNLILTLLILSTVLGMFLNQSEITNFVWGARSEFLCLVTFYASARYLTVHDMDKIFKFFFIFQFVNFGCAFYQYQVMGYYQDLNNGAFIGGAYQDVFCAMLFAYYLYKYSRKEAKLWQLIFVIGSSLYIGVVEEEKFLFIEMAGITAYYVVSLGMSQRNILIIVACVVAGMMALPFLNTVNDQDSMEMLTSWDNFTDYVTMVGYGYELPRIGSSVVISSSFFPSTVQNLFGLGLGMCEEASTLPFINTDFYQHWSWLHYSYFTFQTQFLQTGWVGIILYIALFVSILITNIRRRSSVPDNLKYLSDISVAMSFISIALIWYDNATRGYPANFIFFAMGLGIAVYRQNKFAR